MFHVPHKYRLRDGLLASTDADGNNGAFMIPSPYGGDTIRCVAGDGLGWEHVSVSFHNRIPSWTIMCLVKDLFWDEEDRVMQLHPPKSEYVNTHPYVLHLWRPTFAEIPHPPKEFVG